MNEKLSQAARLRIEQRPIGELVPYANNARKHPKTQIRKIADSLKTFGWTNPIIIDSTGNIICGQPPTFDDMVGFIGDLSGWYVFKARPPENPTPKNSVANYYYLPLKDDELHHAFQFLITGILSVYYDATRRNVKRPGYTAFPARPAQKLGDIPFKGLR
ncbi:MAG: hypothetical protein KUG65_03225 [Sphingomonadaceae bacterium]|nr:hypothetical protein [Sphingomonadaceae bacterium]